MENEVVLFINNLDQSWKVSLAEKLRDLVHEVIPDVEEKIQYKKPHFLKNNQYAAVISPSKDAIAFMIMNTENMDFPKEFGGPKERKWLKIKETDEVDFSLLKSLLAEASGNL